MDYQKRFTRVNEEKHQLRVKLSDIESKLRDLQREIAATNLENQGLKALINGEQELKQERLNEEAYAISIVSDDFKQSLNFTEEEIAKVSRQKEFAQ
jgi:chromosome segregation ATPase